MGTDDVRDLFNKIVDMKKASNVWLSNLFKTTD